MIIATVLTVSVLLGNGLARPHITTAQGIVESGLNPKAVNGGAKGAWQVKEKYWGKVPKDLNGQARHAEKVLSFIMKRDKCSVREALMKYNGSGPSSVRYADKVLRLAKNLRNVKN